VVIAVESTTPGGNPHLLTPPTWYPILRGTTQHALFDVARAAGYDCDYRALRITDLLAAQGIWLISSVTLACRVHTLNGRPLAPSPIAREFDDLVDAAIVSDR
jgi:4-amino-4-deoxychorismate lyase